jgi:hypothetical protein
MSKSITLDLPERVEAALAEVTREEGLSPSEVVAAASDDYIFVRRFRRMRETMLSQARQKFTDEEIFESVS